MQSTVAVRPRPEAAASPGGGRCWGSTAHRPETRRRAPCPPSRPPAAIPSLLLLVPAQKLDPITALGNSRAAYSSSTRLPRQAYSARSGKRRASTSRRESRPRSTRTPRQASWRWSYDASRPVASSERPANQRQLAGSHPKRSRSGCPRSTRSGSWTPSTGRARPSRHLGDRHAVRREENGRRQHDEDAEADEDGEEGEW